MQGWIYIATNTAFPQFIKIGESEREPKIFRIPELQSTGVPEPFKCEYQVLVRNYEGLESRVHKTLDKYRHRQNREFFTCSISEAVASIRELADIESEFDFRSETLKNKELAAAKKLALATRDVLEEFDKVLSSRQEYVSINTPSIKPPGIADYLVTYIGGMLLGSIFGAFVLELGGFSEDAAELVFLVCVSVVLYFGHSSLGEDHRKNVDRVREHIKTEAAKKFPGLHEMRTTSEEVINAKRIYAKANSIDHAKRLLKEEISELSKLHGVKDLLQHEIEEAPGRESNNKSNKTRKSIELINKPFTENILKYIQQFGHPPPPEVLKTQPLDLLDRQAKAALRRKKPISRWRDSINQ